MTSQSFESAVTSHPQLHFRCEPKDGRYLVVNHLGNTFEVKDEDLFGASWDQWEAVLLNKRPARIMTHVTRIVGYYSQLQNWNPSKIAELKDRHLGEYGVPTETHIGRESRVSSAPPSDEAHPPS